jgi:D-alanine-D-alanine ligase
MGITVNPDWWRDCFDDLYLITDARSVCDSDITRAEVDILCDLIRPSSGDRLLDLCGGHGRHSLELSSRGAARCTLVDFSAFLLNVADHQARNLGIDLPCIRADARDTGLPAQSFDHVLIMGNSLGYSTEADADLAILDESHRVLRRGGNILVDVVDGETLRCSFNPNAWHEIGEDIIVCRQRELVDNRVNAREIVISRRSGLLRDHSYSIGFYEPHTLQLLLEGAGFSGVRIHTHFSPHKGKEDYGCMNNRMIAIGIKP